MPVTNFNPPTSGNGLLQYRDAATWAIARNATSSTEAVVTTGPNIILYTEKTAGMFYIIRSFFPFLTGNVLQGSQIRSATFSIYGDSGLFANPISESAVLTASTQADGATLAQADYDNITLNSPTELASRITYASWNQNGYNNFTLNAAGIAALNKTPGGYTKFCLRTSSDVDNVEPGTISSYISGNFVEETGKEPKLTVDFLTGGSFIFNMI